MRLHRLSTATLLVTALVGLPSRASAQSLWTELSTVGYGGLGVGAGVWMSGDNLYAFDGKILLGAVVGSLLGYHLGGYAEGLARRGTRPSGPQLWAARIGTVAGMASLGAAAAGIYITFTGGNETGEDERNLTRAILAGAAAGVVLEYFLERSLEDRFVAGLTPRIGLLPDGGVSFGASFATR